MNIYKKLPKYMIIPPLGGGSWSLNLVHLTPEHFSTSMLLPPGLVCNIMSVLPKCSLGLNLIDHVFCSEADFVIAVVHKSTYKAFALKIQLQNLEEFLM